MQTIPKREPDVKLPQEAIARELHLWIEENVFYIPDTDYIGNSVSGDRPYETCQDLVETTAEMVDKFPKRALVCQEYLANLAIMEHVL